MSVQNSIDQAPTGMLDMQAGNSGNTAFSSFQNEFISHALDRNTTMGGVLAGMDDTVAESLNGIDDAEAKMVGGDKAMPVVSASQPNENLAKSNLIVNEGSKQYLDIPNPATDIYNSASAKAAFDRLFESKKPATATAA